MINLYRSAPLYARDIHGNVIEWCCEVEEHLERTAATITKSYGRVGGKIQKRVTTVTSGKNTGKSNATTPYSQAVKEAKAMAKHKIKEGYRSLEDMHIVCNSVSNNTDSIIYAYKGSASSNLKVILDEAVPNQRLDENNFNKPMKATKYKGKMKMPCIVQAKINGVRAFISYRELPQAGLFDDGKQVVISSKEGLIYRVSHVEDWFKENVFDNPNNHDIVFDGELYIMGSTVTTIGGAAKNPHNPKHKRLTFICFDLAISELNNLERDNLREDALGFHNITANPHTRLAARWYPVIGLASNECPTQSEVMYWTDILIQSGFEGAILRDPDAEYQFGSRKITMQKSKKFFDAEFKLIDIIPTERDTDKDGRPVGLFVCKNDTNDLTFSVTPHGYTKDEKADMLISKETYIGKLVTVKFYERTKNGLPFHANGHIRDYE